ncbi:MAG: hypothetical protein PVJ68_11310 [Candidatus Thiodiazotropha sp.]|jgi:hypothetical protein
MQLPSPISTWSEILRLFPDDIAHTLRSLSNRLAPLMGPLPQTVKQGIEQADGFDGLSNRGHYERLLMTEWAMARCAPDEFLRRATAGEHLFLEPARKQPHEQKGIVVLFDAGPNQIGKPRLLHLALLILLARRAEQARADFFWGLFQDPDCKCHRAINQATVSALLEGRSPSPLGEKWLTPWQEHLSRHNLLECWCVTPSPFDSVFQQQGNIRIDEPLTAKVDRLRVSVENSNRRKGTEIELPPDNIAIRLLRQPFTPPPSRKIRSNKRQSNIIISHNGRKLAYCTDNTLYLHSIPGSPNAKPGRVRTLTFPPDQQLVAVNISRKRLSAITQNSGYWYYHRFPGLPEVLQQNMSQRIPLAEGRITPFFFDQLSKGNRLLLLDANQRVRSMQLPPEKNLFQAIAQQVFYLGDSGVGPCYARHSGAGEIELVWYPGAEKPCKASFSSIDSRSPGFFIHASGGWNKCRFGAVAVEQSNNRWSLHSHQRNIEVDLQSDDQPCGVLNHSLEADIKGHNNLWLIVHNPSEQAVYALGDQQRYPLMENCGVIDQVSLNPKHPYLHYVSEQGDDLVYCLQRRVELMRISMEPET